ncbi:MULTISPECIES: DUF6141 family protein [unclassified Flavobacterium]|jgi:hypothetical protein|uniref:DUF6141 family protein n=1 Tax=unclassified Flavobacterium TaxID=196869 RepID=UPI0025B92067|nr:MULTISPECIES: DUF6141 family protein [unclassified Flavobacterium]
MENDILFTEQQKFKQWWLWLILLAVNFVFIFGIYKQMILGQPFGDKPMSNIGLFMGFGIVLLLTILFYYFKLETTLKTDGIYVRFFPIHIKYKIYTWDMINKSFVRKYNAITEYGGWGVRYGIFGSGKALNVSGNQGLQLVFANNKKLLIGTNKPQELSEALLKIGQLKP